MPKKPFWDYKRKKIDDDKRYQVSIRIRQWRQDIMGYLDRIVPRCDAALWLEIIYKYSKQFEFTCDNLPGVSKRADSGKYMARITLNQKQISIGCYDDPVSAYNAILKYKDDNGIA